MSRKWERMVRKNAKDVRKKKGVTPSVRSSDGTDTFKGRSWVMPFVLVAIGVFSFMVFREQPDQSSMYWVTSASYILLALLIYWVRRPLLKISKHSISSRRFGGDRYYDAEQIEDITIGKDAVVIRFKGKNGRWVFSKLFHQMPMEAMNAKLIEFAEKNQVAVNKQS
ncbi:hypothetical protein [Paenibacillus sp. YYML68]|uniref:hypothetical protein n=1 Tax=Paenibacillus sp. YYML68 TaxID=2909250 RepID=UPI00249229CF|nr:hypothetical protein [Paenibacillus sp. YYML68]